jgi:hypothetical protein
MGLVLMSVFTMRDNKSSPAQSGFSREGGLEGVEVAYCRADCRSEGMAK